MPATVDLRARTADVAPADRVEYWLDLVSRVMLPLEAGPSTTAPFAGRIRAVRLGAILVCDIAAQPHTVRRTTCLISRTEVASYKVALSLQGSCLFVQEGREALLTPGDFAFYDADRPYSLTCTDSIRMLVLMFPRDRMPLPRHEVDRVTAQRISSESGLGSVVSRFLIGLSEQIADCIPAAGAMLADSTIDLLAGLVAQRTAASLGAEPHVAAQVTLSQAKAFIDENLHDPWLDTEAVAAAVYVSTRHLQRLFATQGVGVAAWIRNRRLERCRQELVSPAFLGRPVSAVAARSGLVDPANFSRLFRASFGCTPKEYRELRRAEVGGMQDVGMIA